MHLCLSCVSMGACMWRPWMLFLRRTTHTGFFFQAKVSHLDGGSWIQLCWLVSGFWGYAGWPVGSGELPVSTS